MKLEPTYTIIDKDGSPALEVEGTLEETVDLARKKWGDKTPIFFDGSIATLEREAPHVGGKGARRENPTDGTANAEEAIRGLGKGFPSRITLAELHREFPDTIEGAKKAHAALVKFFPREGDIRFTSVKDKTLTETVGKTYETVEGMTGAFLSTSAKLDKATEGVQGRIPPSVANGLAFLPFNKVRDDEHAGFYPEHPEAKKNRRLISIPADFKGVCLGSSKECRETCLVGVANNAASLNASHAKASRLIALLNEPLAFWRIAIDAIRNFECATRAARKEPFIRLNILSDIPWEAIFPELWDVLPTTRFYDYTKLAGRETAFLGKHEDGTLKYDLTFSFSGANLEACEKELHRGKRLAVVFLVPIKGKRANTKYPLPKKWLGADVIDGDPHDMRSLDPHDGIVVGLRYKPLNLKSNEEGIKMAGRFIVPTWRDDKGNVVCASTPRNENVRNLLTGT